MAAEATSSASGADSTPSLFLHARFEVPQPAAGGNDAAADGCGHGDGGTDTRKAALSTALTEHHFDESNCNAAVVGLPDGVEPVKPEAGDYTYSGMHDHGPLPAPKEGGQFAQLIGLVSAAKKASDEYLTAIIEKEKEAKVSSIVDDKDGKAKQPKRKRT